MAVTHSGMQVHDDLAALFSRNLILDPSKIPQEQQAVVQATTLEPVPEGPQIIYSISQHYNHSAHIARQQQQQQQQQPQQQQQQAERSSSEPPQAGHPASELILSSHGINPASLSQSQLQLFKEADDTQKLRLLELWTICPPANSHNNPSLAWATTSLEQEEQLARVRFEQQQQRQQQQEMALAEQQAAAAAHGSDGPTMMSMDGTPVPVPFQGGDGRWLLEESQHYMMEPYMSSGYETLARREYEASSIDDGPIRYKPAVDPVYKAVHSPVDWATRQRAMEDQYGAFTQCRMEL